MKATGIVRRIDDLGRVVVPKEIRRTLRLREGEPMEIFTGKDGEIILKKYSPVGELENHARELAESIAQITGYLTCVADTDQIIAACGHGQREYQGKSISPELESLIKGRENRLHQNVRGNQIPVILDDTMEDISQIICPIISAGDVLGAVLLLGKSKKQLLGELELKIASVAAGFLGKQMEQ